MKNQTIILLFLSILLAGCQSGKALNSFLKVEYDAYHSKKSESGDIRIHYRKTRVDYGPFREEKGKSICYWCEDFYILRLFWEVGVGNTEYKKYERIFNIKSLLEEQDIYSKLRHDIYLVKILPYIIVNIKDDAISIMIELQDKHGTILEGHKLYREKL